MSLFERRLTVTATTGRVSVDSPLARPPIAEAYYRVLVEVKNGRGSMESPDNATLYMRVLNPDGTEFAGGTRLYDDSVGSNPLDDSVNGTFPHAGAFWAEQNVELSDGRFEAFLKIATGDTEYPITVEVGWEEQGRLQYASKRTKIGDAADLDVVAADASDAKTASEAAETSSAANKLAIDSGSTGLVVIKGDTAAAKTASEANQTTLGTPADTDLATDIANIQSVADLGATAAALQIVDNELAVVDGVVDAIKTETDLLGAPAGVSHAADAAAIKAVVDLAATAAALQIVDNELAVVDGIVDDIKVETDLLGAPAGASHAADVAAIKAQTAAIEADTQSIEPKVDTIGTDVGLIQDDLDNGLDGLTALKAAIDGVQNSVDDVQNNTRFTTGLPSTIRIPATGAEPIEFNANLHDGSGDMEDPDDAEMGIRIKRPDGTYITDRLHQISGFVDPLEEVATNDELAPLTLEYTPTGGSFVNGELITGAPSGATATLMTDNPGVSMVLTGVTGTFTDADAISGPGGGGADLDVVTPNGWRIMEKEAVGKYFCFYENDSADSAEDLIVEFGWVEATVAAYRSRSLSVVDLVDLADAVWDEVLPGAHVGDDAAGKFIAGIGEFLDNSNLATLKAVLGEGFENADVPLSSALAPSMPIFNVVASAAGTITLEAVTGYLPPSAENNTYINQLLVVLNGASQWTLLICGGYVGATKVLTHHLAGTTIPTGSKVGWILDFVGHPYDNASYSWDDTGATIGSSLKLAWNTWMGDPTGDTLASFLAKIGDSGDAATTQSILGLLGDPEDAAVDLPAGTASLFAALRKALDEVGALQADVGDFSSETNLQSLLDYLGGHFDDTDVPLADVLNQLAHLFEVADAGVVTVHGDLTTEPSVNDEYLGAISGATYVWVHSFQDGEGTETLGYWSYSGGTPEAETLNRQTGAGDATIAVGYVYSGFTLQAHANGATPYPASDAYMGLMLTVLNGTDRFRDAFIMGYDGANHVIACGSADGPLLTPAVGDTIGIPYNQNGHAYTPSRIGFDGEGLTLMGALRRVAEVFLGDPTGDTLTSFLAKIGDQGDAATDQSLLGLVGDPVDAAGEAVAASSLFARLRQIEDDIAGVAAGSGIQRSSFIAYPYGGSGVLTSDPTSQEQAASNNSGFDTYRILDKVTISPPEGSSASINSLAITLAWTSQGTPGAGTGAGDTIWYIGPDSESQTAGDAPGGTAVPLTDGIPMTSSKVTHRRSGIVPASMIPATGGIHLMLCGKVDNVTDAAVGTMLDESNVEVDYEV